VVNTPAELIEHPHSEMLLLHGLKPQAVPRPATANMAHAAAIKALQIGGCFIARTLPRPLVAPGVFSVSLTLLGNLGQSEPLVG